MAKHAWLASHNAVHRAVEMCCHTETMHNSAVSLRYALVRHTMWCNRATMQVLGQIKSFSSLYV